MAKHTKRQKMLSVTRKAFNSAGGFFFSLRCLTLLTQWASSFLLCAARIAIMKNLDPRSNPDLLIRLNKLPTATPILNYE